uniref:cytochrome c-type biogenesis CcmF C-terminal domain-containing protein n=1 Tax=uncultured Parasutterella sp. TaxID=1263098 RepID=UPI00272BEF7D
NVLGSWWAYNELGWGGWWFWDPVENSSFIPWLLASAQLHAFLLARKRHKLCKSVLFIPIAAFTVSLIGTFIVRSGVIQSVHAFASDPNKGLFLIAITVLMALPALILFARNAVFFKGDTSEINAYDAAVSMAVMILSAAAAVVLFGTVFPLIYQGFGLGSLSVGAPYFNSIFAPLTIAAALLISGFTLFRQRAAAVAAVIAVSAASSAAIFFFLHPKEEIMTAFAVFACAMLFLSLITEALIKHVGQNWFAFLAHLGIAVSMVGVIGDTQFQQEALVRMGPGYGRPLGDFIFVYDRTDKVDSKSFYADEGRIIVLDKDEKEITELRPQRQTFKSNGMQMTHASISHGLFCDLYVSMGNQLSAEEYLMRLNIKPMMIWLWLGGLLMIFGLFFARTFRREKDLS